MEEAWKFRGCLPAEPKGRGHVVAIVNQLAQSEPRVPLSRQVGTHPAGKSADGQEAA